MTVIFILIDNTDVHSYYLFVVFL